MELVSLSMTKKNAAKEPQDNVKEFPVAAPPDPVGPQPPDETLACGMCLQEKPPEVLVPICSQCASKLELYIKHVLANMNEILKMLYPKASGN